ncbi:MauE/DoxX family redox-associated membrane protein [Actinokineospora terrae]|uniref:MauE/DoxX family redox-associated membrane protein n=1 Tax=Actinokineospora terrae TaxID=155974 RepID=UPI003CCC08AF
MFDIVGTLFRLGLAGVWLVSGWLKVSDPNQTYIAVQAYDVLPGGLVSVVAAAMPFLELALGVLLLLGLGTRLTGVLSVLVLLAFIAAVAQSWARGLSIDCGCFGGGGAVAEGDTRYPQEIARDAGFLLMAVWLVVRPRTRLSLDGRFAPTAADEDVEPDDDLDDADLDDADLDGTDLDGTDLDGTDLDGTDLDGAQLDGAGPANTRLGGAGLSGAGSAGVGLVDGRAPASGARVDGARADEVPGRDEAPGRSSGERGPAR